MTGFISGRSGLELKMSDFRQIRTNSRIQCIKLDFINSHICFHTLDGINN